LKFPVFGLKPKIEKVILKYINGFRIIFIGLCTQ